MVAGTCLGWAVPWNGAGMSESPGSLAIDDGQHDTGDADDTRKQRFLTGLHTPPLLARFFSIAAPDTAELD